MNLCSDGLVRSAVYLEFDKETSDQKTVVVGAARGLALEVQLRCKLQNAVLVQLNDRGYTVVKGLNRH